MFVFCLQCFQLFIQKGDRDKGKGGMMGMTSEGERDRLVVISILFHFSFLFNLYIFRLQFWWDREILVSVIVFCLVSLCNSLSLYSLYNPKLLEVKILWHTHWCPFKLYLSLFLFMGHLIWKWTMAPIGYRERKRGKMRKLFGIWPTS